MQRKLSMPFWCVRSTVGDPFGGPVMDSITSIEACEILCDAKKQGLIDFTSTHDDDIVAWDPSHPMDDQDPNSECYKTIHTLKEMMDKAGLKMKMVTCSLHGDKLFRNGGLTNPDPEIRAMAAQKVMRTLRIGNFFGAEYFTYWVARDGFECQFAVDWATPYKYIEQGLNLATRYIKENKLSIKYCTIEPKPNEPRGEMYLATTGHALALISRLEDSSMWGVNPELLQHEGMTNLSASNAAAMAINAGKLPFLHVGNQKAGQFDNDSPVLTGMDGLKEMVGLVWILEKLDWKGHIEFDNHVLRTDAAPGDKNKIQVRKDFVKFNVESWRLAEKKAEQLAANKDLDKARATVLGKTAAISKALDSYDLQAIQAAKFDYQKLVETPTSNANIDHAFNKALLGM
jgi:xylose isomerase